MSFSSDVKAEIARDIPSARHCRTASLAVILCCLGRFETDPDGGYRLLLNADNEEAVRKCFTLVRKTINIGVVSCSVADDSCRERRGWVQIELPSDMVVRLAQMTGAADSSGSLRRDRNVKVADDLIRRRCCKRNYVRDL
ncbi:MAG: hypothetical protein ACSW78_01630, partial [Lachnospiraceae bacterium]